MTKLEEKGFILSNTSGSSNPFTEEFERTIAAIASALGSSIVDITSAVSSLSSSDVSIDMSTLSKENSEKEYKEWQRQNLVGVGKGRQAKMRQKYNGRARKKAIKDE